MATIRLIPWKFKERPVVLECHSARSEMALIHPPQNALQKVISGVLRNRSMKSAKGTAKLLRLPDHEERIVEEGSVGKPNRVAGSIKTAIPDRVRRMRQMEMRIQPVYQPPPHFYSPRLLWYRV